MRARLLALTVLLCVAGTGVPAAGASAATYHAFLCRVPYGPAAGTPAPTDGTTYAPNGGFTYAGQSCSGGGAMMAAMDGMTTHAVTEGGTVTFTAPAGMTVAGFSVWRHEEAGPFVDFAAPATNLLYTGAPSVQGLCARSLGCASRGTASTPLAAANMVDVGNLSGVTQVIWSAVCGGDPAVGNRCPASGTQFSALYEVFAADMLLNDPAPPTVTGVAGPLVAGGTLRGAQSVSFNAADPGSGVHKGALLVDGVVVSDQVLDANGGACADRGVAPDQRPSFVNTQPCPPAVSGVLTLDTDALTPGAHALTVRVTDAAGNPAVASTSTITVAGTVPAGTANGSGASRAAKLTARHASTRRSARRLSFTARPTITGRLVDEGGAPIASAAVAVLARERRAGATARAIATATTGADGSFRATLPSGPSRTITVQYTAFGGDARPAALKRLLVLVRARLSAAISPRSPRVGRRLRLSGRLRYLRRAGVDVAIQANQRGVWRTVDTVKTRSDGRFSWPYRFLPGQGGRTYAFRARVSSPIYPFAAGNSAVIRVRVRR